MHQQTLSIRSLFRIGLIAVALVFGLSIFEDVYSFQSISSLMGKNWSTETTVSSSKASLPFLNWTFIGAGMVGNQSKMTGSRSSVRGMTTESTNLTLSVSTEAHDTEIIMNHNNSMELNISNATDIFNAMSSSNQTDAEDRDKSLTPPSDNSVILPTIENVTNDRAILSFAPTIVIQLSGEMANQIGKLAMGCAVKWLLEEDFNVTSNIILRHQEHPKWIRAWHSIESCYPRIRYMDPSQGNTREFNDRIAQQEFRLGVNPFTPLVANTILDLTRTLTEFVRIISDTRNLPKMSATTNITMPFIYSDAFASADVVNRFFYRIRDLFEYDEDNPKCCDQKAQANESILHARGFQREMPKLAIPKGFEEISVNKSTTELLANHHPGDKFAVISRSASFGQQYVDQMIANGLDARLVETETGEQSFCFLMSGQNEIIGVSMSTFTWWASVLGNASKARIYSLHTPERVRRFGDRYFVTYNFSNPLLKEKFSFELYNSERQDEIEQAQTRQQANA